MGAISFIYREYFNNVLFDPDNESRKFIKCNIYSRIFTHKVYDDY